ncbi:MAG: murein L,D-transpeptidase [Halanaerobiales bacterium]
MQRIYKRIIIIILLIFITSSVVEGNSGMQYKGDLWNLLNYFRIRSAVVKYKEIERMGGWPTIPYDLILKKGDVSEEVQLLKKRLNITGDLYYNNEDNLFDENLETALKNYQKRNGLVIDGILGPATIDELNLPVSIRIKQLELNMNKIYNLFDQYLNRYILVNIPAYQLKFIDNGEEVLQMKAIVGSKSNQTPVFNDQVEYLVFNPTWRIPLKKAVKDIIPLIKENPYYLKDKNIRVFESWEDDAREIEPENIDWEEYNSENFDLMLEQESGPDNELGQVKFMFPNDYLVYIHDTPHTELFDYKNRAFSSGCIRVEKPLELANYCLKDLEGWNFERILEVINAGAQTQVDLIEYIPVVLVYWTAWVDFENNVNFRQDIYDLL